MTKTESRIISAEKPEEPVNADNYEEKRAALLELNANLKGVVLRPDEVCLDRMFSQLKKEYILTCSGADLSRASALSASEIRDSRLYRFCRELPKGADLHVHDMTLLPVRELAELLAECPEFYIHPGDGAFDLLWAEKEEQVPEGYLRFCSWMNADESRIHDLLRHWTVLGAEASGMGIWAYFEELFKKHGALSDSCAFVERYYLRAFRYYCRSNIQHVEIHLMMTGDCSWNAAYVRAIRQAYYAVKTEYPAFTVRIIGAGVKADNENLELSRSCFRNTVYAQEHIKDEFFPDQPENFVVGFDLVNEEDRGFPLKNFVPMLLEAKEKYPDIRFFLHGGESLDAGNENLIDAYLLGAARVGHGLNLYRYPDLLRRYAETEICLEVCPVSNQALKYTEDVRSHPVVQYLKCGVPAAICSDDPVYMENETLTDDFFAAAVSWNLDLADIKTLCINSLMYSGLDGKSRKAALKSFGRQWDAFVKKWTEAV